MRPDSQHRLGSAGLMGILAPCTVRLQIANIASVPGMQQHLHEPVCGGTKLMNLVCGTAITCVGSRPTWFTRNWAIRQQRGQRPRATCSGNGYQHYSGGCGGGAGGKG